MNLSLSDRLLHLALAKEPPAKALRNAGTIRDCGLLVQARGRPTAGVGGRARFMAAPFAIILPLRIVRQSGFTEVLECRVARNMVKDTAPPMPANTVEVDCVMSDTTMNIPRVWRKRKVMILYFGCKHHQSLEPFLNVPTKVTPGTLQRCAEVGKMSSIAEGAGPSSMAPSTYTTASSLGIRNAYRYRISCYMLLLLFQLSARYCQQMMGITAILSSIFLRLSGAP